MRNKVRKIIINKIIIIGSIINSSNNIKLNLSKNWINKIMVNLNRMKSSMKIINLNKYIPMVARVELVEEDLEGILIPIYNMLQELPAILEEDLSMLHYINSSKIMNNIITVLANEDMINNKNNKFPYKPNNRINTTIKTSNNHKKNNSVK
jgi:hypothetical protein